jgi:PAS domain S-box-containing protein
MKRARGAGASRPARSEEPAAAIEGGEAPTGELPPAPPAAGRRTARGQPSDTYRSFFENLFDGVFQSTPDGRILTANPALVEMLGYDSEEQLRSVNIIDLYESPDARPALLEKLASDGEIRNQELVLRTRSGERLLVLENSRGVHDEKGNLLCFEGSLTDITAWRDAESLFRTLAESSPVGIFIAQDSRFIFANPTFLELTGYPEDELLNTGPLDLLVEEERERALQNALDMLSGRSSDAFEHRLVHRNGDVVWTLATVSFISYRGRQAVLGNFIDITERKQAQDLFQTLADSSPVAFFIVQDNRFQFVNPRCCGSGRTENRSRSPRSTGRGQAEDRELVAASAACPRER